MPNDKIDTTMVLKGENGHGLHLRSAVALNNSALARFEGQNCLEAHFLLKETLSVLRQGLQSRRDHSIRKRPARESLSVDARNVLTRAKDNASRVRLQANSPPVRVVADDSFDLPRDTASFASSSPLCLIRIEVHDSIDGIDEDSVLAIVAFNYGLSFLCLARLSSSPQRSVKMRESALKIFRIARGFLSARPHVHLRTLLVSALLTRAAFHTMIQVGQADQAKQVLPFLNQCEMQFEACRRVCLANDGKDAFHKAPAA
jgi:hypothetical protein